MATSFSETSEAIEFMVNHGIPIAQLSIISLAKLHANDPAELVLLDEAASNTGFFYLDLRGDDIGERMLTSLPEVYAAAKKYFAQPEEAKLKDARLDIKASQDIGWKKSYGGESFEISRDEMTMKGPSNAHLPQLFQDKWTKIVEFNAGCNDACLTLLNRLSATVAVYHRLDEPSDTGLKLVLHPSVEKLSDVGETLHTDSGTLTLLFHNECSIQAFLPDAKLWAFTPPLDGCVLANVGDSLQKLSGGKFYSPQHRVTQPFDGAKNRYYLSYFLRPEMSLLDTWGSTK